MFSFSAAARSRTAPAQLGGRGWRQQRGRCAGARLCAAAGGSAHPGGAPVPNGGGWNGVGKQSRSWELRGLGCLLAERWHPGVHRVLGESTRRELCCPARTQAPAALKAELPGADAGHLWDLGLCRELAVSVPARRGRTQEARHGAAWRGSQPRLPHRRLVMLWHMPGRAAALLTVPVRTVQAAAVQHSQRRASQLQQGVVAEVLGMGQSLGCCCGAGAG